MLSLCSDNFGLSIENNSFALSELIFTCFQGKKCVTTTITLHMDDVLDAEDILLVLDLLEEQISLL